MKTTNFRFRFTKIERGKREADEVLWLSALYDFVDGVLQDDVVSMSFSGSSTNTVEIGRLNVGQASNYFNGSIDEVVVFNKALKASFVNI